MSLIRAKDEWVGWWLYCPDCGHKAYQSSIRGYYLCADACGYFDIKKAITNPNNPMKNVRQVKVIE
tara:strand:- start:6537 stop:6734 length:198 start_codon:yes stop_codon:yes gene_type:complete